MVDYKDIYNQDVIQDITLLDFCLQPILHSLATIALYKIKNTLKEFLLGRSKSFIR